MLPQKAPGRGGTSADADQIIRSPFPPCLFDIDLEHVGLDLGGDTITELLGEGAHYQVQIGPTFVAELNRIRANAPRAHSRIPLQGTHWPSGVVGGVVFRDGLGAGAAQWAIGGWERAASHLSN